MNELINELPIGHSCCYSINLYFSKPSLENFASYYDFSIFLSYLNTPPPPAPPLQRFRCWHLGWTATKVEPAKFQPMGGWKGRAENGNRMLKQHYYFRDFEIKICGKGIKKWEWEYIYPCLYFRSV
jgi:hypothetical protein